jgi:hypothetical protein
MGCGIAHLFSFVSTIQVRWFKEAVVVDWRDAIASRDLRTMSQYLHGLVLAAARGAAALYHRGAGHLAALLQLALSLSATHRRSCWAAWVDLTGFLGSNPAAGAFLVAAFSVALIDHALLPAVRARVRTLTVRSTNETEKPARNWRYAASAGSAVAVLLTASVALALLSTGQGTVSPLLPVDLTSEPPVVGVVLDETRWLLKVSYPLSTVGHLSNCLCILIRIDDHGLRGGGVVLVRRKRAAEPRSPGGGGDPGHPQVGKIKGCPDLT